MAAPPPPLLIRWCRGWRWVTFELKFLGVLIFAQLMPALPLGPTLMKRFLKVTPADSGQHRILQNWITLLLIIDGLLILASISMPGYFLWDLALNIVLYLTVTLLIVDLALTLFKHRKNPIHFLRNPWNILDIITLIVVLGLPAYRSFILMRFGRFLSHLISVGSRSILKSVFLARSALQRAAMQVQAETQSRVWDLALQGSNDGLWEWNLSEKTFTFSQRWRELHGYGSGYPADSYGAWLDCIHPDDRPLVLQALEEHLEGKQSFFSMEYRSLFADGNYGWFVGRGLALRDETGEPLLMIGAEADISNLRNSELRLEYREKIIREIFDNVPLLLAVYDDDGNVSLANQLFKDTLGIHCQGPDNSAIQLKNLSESLKDHQKILQMIQQDRSEWQEFALTTEAGKILDLSWLSSRLDDSSTILLGQDLTYRHRVENALAQEREFAQVTLRSIGDAVITIDLTGRVETFNPVAEKLTGWSQEEAWHQPLDQVINLYGLTTEERRPALTMRGIEENQLELWRGRHLLVSKTGQQSVVAGSANVICDRHQNVVGAVLAFRDMTQSYYLEQELSWQATHDALTGLYNYRALETRIQELIGEAFDEPYNHVLCYIDVEQIDLVNSIFGYVAGDQFLSYAAQTFKHYFRSADVIARLGGDEFGILLSFCSLRKATKMIEAFRRGTRTERFIWQEQAFALSPNIGLVQWGNTNKASENILNVAAATCHNAKRGGKNQLEIYTWNPQDIDDHYGNQSWLIKVNKALVHGEFCLFGQKIIPLDSGLQPIIYEVLIRMVDESGKLIAPGCFLPVAEQYNLMPDLDRWVVSNFLNRYWPLLERSSDHCIYTINLSGASLSSEGFFEFLKELLDVPGSPANKICFEVTETMAIANLQKATKFIEEIKSLGCLFALDDFGSGMSSLAYLRTLPVDYLKIDGMFVRDIVTNQVDRTMVESCHRIAHSLGIQTIAEYAENDRTIERLRAIGIDYAQGFGIAYPKDLATLMEEPIVVS